MWPTESPTYRTFGQERKTDFGLALNSVLGTLVDEDVDFFEVDLVSLTGGQVEVAGLEPDGDGGVLVFGLLAMFLTKLTFLTTVLVGFSNFDSSVFSLAMAPERSFHFSLVISFIPPIFVSR